MEDLTRIVAGVEYDGSRFFGFQRQRQTPTVQQELEQAISAVADHPVTVHCAGRTDTGVHATAQVIHFDTHVERSERAWVLGINTGLARSVSVLWARKVPSDFHVRFSARSRSYRYRILNRWVRPGLEQARITWVRAPLDAGRMHAAARCLLGEHDFSSFRAPGCQARHPVRTIHELTVARQGDEVHIDIRANAFLYHMVRNIAGTLIEVGAARKPPDWVANVLECRRRVDAGPTAPADGLFFTGVEYDVAAGIPSAANAFPRGWNLSG